MVAVSVTIGVTSMIASSAAPGALAEGTLLADIYIIAAAIVSRSRGDTRAYRAPRSQPPGIRAIETAAT
jgi:hypothetical protein